MWCAATVARYEDGACGGKTRSRDDDSTAPMIAVDVRAATAKGNPLQQRRLTRTDQQQPPRLHTNDTQEGAWCGAPTPHERAASQPCPLGRSPADQTPRPHAVGDATSCAEIV